MERVKVWDPAVRLSHLAMGVLVLAAFLTSEEDERLPLHMRVGLLVLGVVVFRLVWGFVGTRHARFADFVRGPRAILEAARAMARGAPKHFLGHNPVGAVMVLTLLATLAVVAGTGLALGLGPDWDGPLALSKPALRGLKEVHEGAAEALPVLIALHVAGVLLSSFLERQNLVAGMVTGFKRGSEIAPPVTPARTVAGFVFAALFASAAVAGLWKLLPIAEAEAASPLLERYADQARAEEPTFTGFDAARGKALYFTEHATATGSTSCASCHSADPSTPGRTPVGKRLDALSPSVTPERFTDRAKADKWFDRNCTQVLGRRCTARERGDFITFVSTH